MIKHEKCPPLVYATRHPIKNWEEIKDNKAIIPDLDDVLMRGNTSKAKAPFQGVNTTYDIKPIANGSAMYYARYMVDGKIKDVVCTLD